MVPPTARPIALTSTRGTACDQAAPFITPSGPLKTVLGSSCIRNRRPAVSAVSLPMLIDQGTDDEFLAEQLYPQNLKAACEERGIPLTLRMQEGYDHSYHFIATFIGEHLAWHAAALKQ